MLTTTLIGGCDYQADLALANQYSGRDRQVIQASALTTPAVGMQIYDF